MENSKKEKFFIITIDTEADNQWNHDSDFSTNNAKYLPRFQKLCEKYNYKPVWLTTYEMANDDFFVEFFKSKQDKNLCEIGMHLHAWNTPPNYQLNAINQEKSYLIEYPISVMDSKIKKLDQLLTKRFGKKPITHRAGRWAMNDEYYKLLKKYNYAIDCSITPHINWVKSIGATGMPGSNYKKESENINYKYGILEIPLTIKKIRLLEITSMKNIKQILKQLYRFVFGKYQWVRPDKSFNINGIKKVIDICCKNNEYIMFMIHSSELMPGGSPNFKNEEDIEKLYYNIEDIFKYIQSKGYNGITLYDYYERIKKCKK